MHELSLGTNIISILKQRLGKDINLLRAINLAVGELANVDIDSLKFWFNTILKEEKLYNVKLTVVITPAMAMCITCGLQFNVHSYMDTCPKCHNCTRDITSGCELIIESIEVNQ